MRRKTLTDGIPMMLVIVGIGDADWRFEKVALRQLIVLKNPSLQTLRKLEFAGASGALILFKLKSGGISW